MEGDEKKLLERRFGVFGWSVEVGLFGLGGGKVDQSAAVACLQQYIAILLTDEILHHLGALNYCNSWILGTLGGARFSPSTVLLKPNGSLSKQIL